ncbi:hypothetical protein CWI36_0082p0040 [Hamiltosporidium magnivora]|uniref:Uncharacterized protein n=1 Tax=Hamiltosporidium magnivora TaxID=148818 RepID=A0A4Q9LN49_9MICR|nr:hypothetical protein CWI36_0082p0040 [Hamiltosporidium magnivora]
MSNSNVNIEKSSTEKLSPTFSNITFKMEFKSILNHLLKMYFMYTQNIIQIQNNKISGLDAVTSGNVVCILLRTAKYKLVILNNLLTLNYALNYAYSFNMNSNTENLFVNVKDIPSAFLKREMLLFEMILKISRKATEESKYNLIEILNSLIETGIKTMQDDYSTIKKLCQP